MRRSPPSIEQRVQRAVKKNREIKYADRYQAVQAVTNAGATLDILNGLVRGDDAFNNFDGNTIYPQSVSVNYNFFTNQSYNSVRIMVVQWMENSTPGTSDILQDNATHIAPISFPAVNSKGRMRVLADRQHILSPTAAGTSIVYGDGCVNGQIYIPGSRVAPVKFRVGSTDKLTGGLFVFIVSDDAVATFPACNLASRVSFFD